MDAGWVISGPGAFVLVLCLVITGLGTFIVDPGSAITNLDDLGCIQA